MRSWREFVNQRNLYALNAKTKYTDVVIVARYLKTTTRKSNALLTD